MFSIPRAGRIVNAAFVRICVFRLQSTERRRKMCAFFQVSMMFPVLTRPTRKSAQIRAKMRKNFKNHLDKGASACYNIACRSERIGYSSLAQSVERVTVNHDVVGSSPTGGAKEKTIRTGWSFSLLLVSLRSKEFAGFASRNRRRTAAEGKLIGGCCADAVEPQQGEPGKSTCFRKCFFSYIRLAASDIAFGSDIRRCRVIFASRV